MLNGTFQFKGRGQDCGHTDACKSMPLSDITNANQTTRAKVKQGAISTLSPEAVDLCAPQDAVPPHLRDPTFGLGEALFAMPALAMHNVRLSEGGVCISAAPMPCILEADGGCTSNESDGGLASFKLGMCYLQGKGVHKDACKAVEFFVKGAEAGDRNAMFNLAICYTQGLGCNRDDVKAFEYFTRAAEKGDPKAQLQVGVCQITGRGTQIDETKAAASFRLASEAGDATAQYNFGVCLSKGRGVAKDLNEAAKWYRRSAEQGDPMAQFRLALCFATGKGTEKSPEQAVEWYHKAAQENHGGALFNLGVCFAQGDGVDRDDAKALGYYRQAADLGVVQAQHNLALCLLTGVGTAKDAEEAVEWYLKAAKQGDAKAQFAAGVCFEVGQGTEKDLERAVQLYENSAEQGNVKACVALALCYKSGAGVEENQQKAFKLIEAAAHKGNHRAMYHLGLHFLNPPKGVLEWPDINIESDHEKAVQWFKAAAEKGNADAAQALKRLARKSPPCASQSSQSERLPERKLALAGTGAAPVQSPATAPAILDELTSIELKLTYGVGRVAEASEAARLPPTSAKPNSSNISIDSFADLTTTSNMLDASITNLESLPHSDANVSMGAAADSTNSFGHAAPPPSSLVFRPQSEAPDGRFSCAGAGLAPAAGLSPEDFDVVGRTSMAPEFVEPHKKQYKASASMASEVGEAVESRVPKAYPASPAIKQRCGFASFFKRG